MSSPRSPLITSGPAVPVSRSSLMVPTIVVTLPLHKHRHALEGADVTGRPARARIAALIGRRTGGVVRARIERRTADRECVRLRTAAVVGERQQDAADGLVGHDVGGPGDEAFYARVAVVAKQVVVICGDHVGGVVVYADLSRARLRVRSVA